MSRSSRLPELPGVAAPSAAIPEGWRDLDSPPDECVTVDGLLSDGSVVEAEFWGPVPEELWDASGDGSGWAWNGTARFISGEVHGELSAWRPRAAGDEALGDQDVPW